MYSKTAPYYSMFVVFSALRSWASTDLARVAWVLGTSAFAKHTLKHGGTLIWLHRHDILEMPWDSIVHTLCLHGEHEYPNANTWRQAINNEVLVWVCNPRLHNMCHTSQDI